jgi:hypothetical protein
LRGAFYMDRQWGDLPLQDVVEDWIWGHFSGDGVELVYFHVNTRNGPASTRTLLRRGTEWRAGDRLQRAYFAEVRSWPL